MDVHGKRLPGQKKEKVRMEAGGPRLLPEFRDASLGIRAGEARMVEVRYPEDYGDADLAGKTRRYRLVAVEIKEKKLPELDDSFARGIDSGLDLEGLRAKLRLRLEADEMIRSKERLEETVVDRLLAANPVDVPEGVVARGLARVLERARSEAGSSDEQDLREHFRPLIERMHRKDMILEAIARQESQELTEGEMEAALEQQADEAGVDVEVVRKKLDSEGELDRLRETLQERKVLDFVLSQAQIQRIRKPRLRPEAQPSRIIVP
ncbi:MAG: hypothetical protein QUU85_16185 [Candidatus Eisenbacteria bacterium]|nr:hypothetical protein [Candidatus Eisenbacteria bacterium]